MHTDNVNITNLKCNQVQETTKQIVCLWEPEIDLLMSMVISDSIGRNVKMLNVTGVLEVFEAQELTFKETYFITLNNDHTTLTLFGTSNHFWNYTFRSPMRTLTISEYSKITQFICFRREIAKRQIICSWEAEPLALFYELVFSKPDGSKIFTKNVRRKDVTVEIDISSGNTIIASLRNVSTKVELFGMSIHQ